jgi:hypothetical protein
MSFLVFFVWYLVHFQAEQEHTRAKRFYDHTNKGKGFTSQVASQQRRLERSKAIETGSLKPESDDESEDTDSEQETVLDPQKHHHIARSSKHPLRITQFVRDHEGDPVAKVWYNIDYCITKSTG